VLHARYFGTRQLYAPKTVWKSAEDAFKIKILYVIDSWGEGIGRSEGMGLGEIYLESLNLALDAGFSISFQSCKTNSGTESRDSRLTLTSVCVCVCVCVCVVSFQ